MADLPIIGPAYETVTQASTQQLINWYLEALPNKSYDQSPSGLPVYIMRPTPGVSSTPFCATSGETIRGMLVYNSILYAVIDNIFYEINSSGTETSRGTLSTAVGRIRMVAANDQILIVDGTEGYLYIPSTTTFTIVTADAFPDAPSDVDYLDGYFVVAQDNSKRFSVSAVNDATTWDALDFASVNNAHDFLLACKTNGNEIWMFGERGIEPWYVIEDQTFPMQRRAGTYIPFGCAAIDSIALTAGSFIWLSKDDHGHAVVVQSSNYSPQAVSTDALSTAIESYTTIDDAYAFIYRQGLHEFYVLTFPSENVTWVYDLLTGTWHQRTSYNAGEYDYYRWLNYKNAYNKHLVGDARSGNIYELDPDIYSEVGNTIRRVRRTQLLKQSNKAIFITNFIVDVEPGVGLVSGQGSDPQLMLRVSRDGGHTWGNVMSRSLGAQGQYLQRVKWDMLGSSRNWVFELSVTDPVNAVLISATADVAVGSY